MLLANTLRKHVTIYAKKNRKSLYPMASYLAFFLTHLLCLLSGTTCFSFGSLISAFQKPSSCRVASDRVPSRAISRAYPRRSRIYYLDDCACNHDPFASRQDHCDASRLEEITCHGLRPPTLARKEHSSSQSFSLLPVHVIDYGSVLFAVPLQGLWVA
ncbi:hypothetical protein BJY04DRAFT_86591 [Aspergillus karnatakaensis]|uniref:uncharacterized protein n=1 Tax=Aspergillus karnatakaensis TaxID=1810916 RepID=UPI003CCD156C